VVATVLLAVGLYASTNIDNFVVLTTFYADRAYGTAQVTGGEFLGLAVIIGVSAGGAAAASAVPHRYVGLLGVVPLTLGAVKLVALTRGARPADPDPAARRGRHQPFVVSAVTVGNGGDNIAAYVPVLATRSLGDSLVIGAVFAVVTVLWCAGAHAIARSRRTGRVIERVSPVAIPVVYLGLGVSILVLSGTLGLLTGSS
jgi:cadmium resistance protein CadD (predicted permease)